MSSGRTHRWLIILQRSRSPGGSEYQNVTLKSFWVLNDPWMYSCRLFTQNCVEIYGLKINAVVGWDIILKHFKPVQLYTWESSGGMGRVCYDGTPSNLFSGFHPLQWLLLGNTLLTENCNIIVLLLNDYSAQKWYLWRNCTICQCQ